MRSKEYDEFVAKHLKLWKDEGIPAPANELQSIQYWLACLGTNGLEETTSRMRLRMTLLMQQANVVNSLGQGAEDALGIYDDRPEARTTESYKLPERLITQQDCVNYLKYVLGMKYLFGTIVVIKHDLLVSFKVITNSSTLSIHDFEHWPIGILLEVETTDEKLNETTVMEKL